MGKFQQPNAQLEDSGKDILDFFAAYSFSWLIMISALIFSSVQSQEKKVTRINGKRVRILRFSDCKLYARKWQSHVLRSDILLEEAKLNLFRVNLKFEHENHRVISFRVNELILRKLCLAFGLQLQVEQRGE